MVITSTRRGRAPTAASTSPTPTSSTRPRGATCSSPCARACTRASRRPSPGRRGPPRSGPAAPGPCASASTATCAWTASGASPSPTKPRARPGRRSGWKATRRGTTTARGGPWRPPPRSRAWVGQAGDPFWLDAVAAKSFVDGLASGQPFAPDASSAGSPTTGATNVIAVVFEIARDRLPAGPAIGSQTTVPANDHGHRTQVQRGGRPNLAATFLDDPRPRWPTTRATPPPTSRGSGPSSPRRRRGWWGLRARRRTPTATAAAWPGRFCGT